jgi:membrane protease YdiL (CAAX protease family)
MHLPGYPSIFFLIYLVLLLPWLARYSNRQVQVQFGTSFDFSNADLDRIWIGTLLNLGVMLGLAWGTAHTFDYPLFLSPASWWPSALAGGLACVGCLVLREAARLTTSVEERKKLIVYALVPRTRSHQILIVLVVILAGIAEEAAYRGTGWAILDYSLGSSWLAALISSLAFSLGHAIQGKKSMLVILIFGLLMQALCWWTHSLIPAMCVHAIYDFVAFYLTAREAAGWRQESLPP